MFSLAQRRLAGADNPDILAGVGMGHNQDAAVPRHSNRDEPLFGERVIRVMIRQLTVIDWGFPLASLSLVRLFTLSGFPIWWFDGDRDAARESFIRRATVPAQAFTDQMASIDEGWFQIEDLIKDSIITVVSAGPTHAEPEYIYGRMFGE